METWVLIIILLGGSNGTSPAISSIDFKGKENCMTARRDLIMGALKGDRSEYLFKSKIECYLKDGGLK